MIPLYGEYFGLTSQPFSVSPDPKFYYGSPTHREGLAQLTYGIKARRGFVVLTGEVGTGKTTLIHSLLKQLDDGHTHIAFIFTLVTNPKDLLRSVCEDFALTALNDGARDLHDYLALLNQFLLESYRKGDYVALIIDEAQNLSPEVLEGVRLLSNFETSQDKVLQILLVGQPELGERLNRPELRQLKQRVALRYHLNPLSLAECKEYIGKRLEIAGGSASIYPIKTVEAVYTYSGGTPRLINILCDNGMLTAYALAKRNVEVAMIDEIAHDLNLTVAPRKSSVTGADAASIKLWEAASPAPMKENNNNTDGAGLKLQSQYHAGRSFPKPVSSPKAAAEEPQRPDGRRPGPLENFTGRIAESRAETVPSRSLDLMMSALTEAMGPMAPLIVREQIDAMGESFEAFPKQRLGQLVEVTSHEILSEGLKNRYLGLMSDEIRAIHDGKEEP
jgi:type II secretory pathway predicted ATPase ExeA